MPNANGKGHDETRIAPTCPDAAGPLGEALRGALQEALARTARLVAALRQHRRRGRAVGAAAASLRRLRELGG